MKKYKKVITMVVSLLTLSSCYYYVDAFKYTNKDKDEFYKEEDSLKRKNIKTSSVKKQKGFTYSMNVKRPKNAPGNFIDVFNKCFMYILEKNTPYKEKENVNINQFFKNCDYQYGNDSYHSEQYVFGSKDNLQRLRKFYRENMIDRNFSKFCDDYNYSYDNNNNKEVLTKSEYESFLNNYCNRLRERFKRYLNLLKEAYEKKDLNKLEKILRLYYKDTSHSEDVLSFMNQSKNVKELIKRMLKIVKYEQNREKEYLSKKIKKEDDDFFDFSSKLYGDFYNDDDEFFSNKKIFNKYDYDDFDNFYYDLRYIDKKSNFKEYLKAYYKLGVLSIKNLSKVSFEDFKESVKSVDFKRNVEPITREIKQISGTVETLEKN